MKRSSTRNALTLMIGTLGSRITGLLREVLLLALFPARISDAFGIAWTLPNLFRELLAEGALTNAFIPIYQELRQEERRSFSGALFGILFLVNAVLLALALLAAPWLVDLLLATKANVDRDLTITLTRLVFPVLMTISFSALAMGILNSEEFFFAPAWAPVALNVVSIVFMLVFPGQANWLAIAVVCGGLAQFLFQIPALIQHKVLPELGHWWHPKLMLVLTLMAPFAFTTGARQMLNVVAQRITSNELLFDAGAVTAYRIAGMLFSLALGLFAISPAVAFYSRLASDAVKNEAQLKVTLAQGIRFITFLCVPVGIMFNAFSAPIVGVLFTLFKPAQGQENAIQLAMLAIGPLGLALLPVGLNNFLIRPFYIRKKVLTPILISVVFIALNAYLFITLSPTFGIRGLTNATAISAWLQLAALLLWMRRSEGLELLPILSHSLRVWLAAGVAVISSSLLMSWLLNIPNTWTRWLLELSFGGLTSIILYAVLALLLRLPELEQIRKRFQNQQ